MAIDFFAAQESARQRSIWLVLGFFFSTACMVVLLYFATGIGLIFFGVKSETYARWWQWDMCVAVCGALVFLITTLSFFKVRELSEGGGKAVAESLGGRLVLYNTADLNEQRLINIAQEMAIAAGIKPPQVFVLDQQTAINAFAAGNEPREAVVAVTEGSLLQLNRDELQGVIAHEFSHILNGDMRLNMRITGVLHGLCILSIMGKELMEGDVGSSIRFAIGRRYSLYLLGLVFYVIGALGNFFGQLLRAALSRQREFLADAAAVQFTRNADGLLGALSKISRQRVVFKPPHAEAFSHFFFSVPKSDWFSSHPPLKERIARLHGLPAARRVDTTPFARVMDDELTPQVVGLLSAASLAAAGKLLEQLPERLQTACGDPQATIECTLAFILDWQGGQSAAADNTRRFLDRMLARGAAVRIIDYQKMLMKYDPAWHLAYFDLLLSHVRHLLPEDQETLLTLSESAYSVNFQLALKQCCLIRLLKQTIVAKEAPVSLRQKFSMTRWRHACSLLLTLAAYAGNIEGNQLARALARLHDEVFFRKLPPCSLDTIKPDDINAMFHHLSHARPKLKNHLINACAHVMHYDNHINPHEKILLRAICATFNSPMPL